jgi:2-polyprenyl-3-methyl-5-hydroxy-6-metoxy-1,4-benzoquinol methylase
MKRRCLVCDCRKFTALYGNLICCQKCGLIMAKNIPTEAEVNKLYQREYFFGKEYFDYKADRPAIEKNFKKRIKSINDKINKKSYVIEIGSAYGYFLNLIKNKVKKHMGFEVGIDGVEYSRKQFGVNVTNNNFIKCQIGKNKVDLIVMWDVIEHLVEPDKYIKNHQKY